ncbi:hypothetical protein K4F52_009743 [Lecanicillium sp. MT-2017a]|nr:hypothetical protein K4F52_009743 [Lecanicillium sp. MT-2017a]
MATQQPQSSIKLRGRYKRRLATALHTFHSSHRRFSSAAAASEDRIRVVCISDTHNQRLAIPDGDVLIHAGDLTENGSFEEMQAELTWLSAQPHRYKVFVAGNHDVLLDDAFLARYPERRYGDARTKDDLDWGDVIYLQDSCVMLDFELSSGGGRRLTLYGSPWTPQYGVSAFQYRPDEAESHWEARFAAVERMPDVVVTHGPPKHHLDTRDFYRAGCPFLGGEVAKVRPRLVVFGHIHVGHGQQEVVLDGVQRRYEEVMTGWAGWMHLVWMAVLVAWGWVVGGKKGQRGTVFVNASIVGERGNEVVNEAVVVEL